MVVLIGQDSPSVSGCRKYHAVGVHGGLMVATVMVS